MYVIVTLESVFHLYRACLKPSLQVGFSATRIYFYLLTLMFLNHNAIVRFTLYVVLWLYFIVLSFLFYIFVVILNFCVPRRLRNKLFL